MGYYYSTGLGLVETGINDKSEQAAKIEYYIRTTRELKQMISEAELSKIKIVNELRELNNSLGYLEKEFPEEFL